MSAKAKLLQLLKKRGAEQEGYYKHQMDEMANDKRIQMDTIKKLSQKDRVIDPVYLDRESLSLEEKRLVHFLEKSLRATISKIQTSYQTYQSKPSKSTQLKKSEIQGIKSVVNEITKKPLLYPYLTDVLSEAIQELETVNSTNFSSGANQRDVTNIIKSLKEALSLGQSASKNAVPKQSSISTVPTTPAGPTPATPPPVTPSTSGSKETQLTKRILLFIVNHMVVDDTSSKAELNNILDDLLDSVAVTPGLSPTDIGYVTNRVNDIKTELSTNDVPEAIKKALHVTDNDIDKAVKEDLEIHIFETLLPYLTKSKHDIFPVLKQLKKDYKILQLPQYMKKYLVDKVEHIHKLLMKNNMEFALKTSLKLLPTTILQNIDSLATPAKPKKLTISEQELAEKSIFNLLQPYINDHPSVIENVLEQYIQLLDKQAQTRQNKYEKLLARNIIEYVKKVKYSSLDDVLYFKLPNISNLGAPASPSSVLTPLTPFSPVPTSASASAVKKNLFGTGMKQIHDIDTLVDWFDHEIDKILFGVNGAGFWSDFADGFKKGFQMVAKPASTIAHLIPHPASQGVATVIDGANSLVDLL